MFRRGRGFISSALLLILITTAGSILAQVQPDRSGLGQVEFRHSALNISSSFRVPHELPPQAAAQAAGDLAALGANANGGRLDVRGGRWATLTLTEPLVPGKGAGNNLKWSDLGRAAPGSQGEFSRAAGQAFREFVQLNGPALRINVGEVDQPGKATVLRGGALVQIHVPRKYNGIPVRDSYLHGVINHGNLVLFGTNHWGDINLSTSPDVPHDAALAAVQAHVEPYTIDGFWGKSGLIIVPLDPAQGPGLGEIPIGLGYAHRLAWMIRPSFQGELRNYEALVDAHSGELLSFLDTNHYGTARKVQGGVLPEANDGSGPEGTEQAGWPMPFAYVDNVAGTFLTDAGGNLAQCVDGSASTQLDGPFMIMNDACGAISESSTGDIDLGTSAGTDCTVPTGASAGNTHSSRSGFYEMNRIKEMARGQLPNNTWLQQQLQANMNINSTCNAFWDLGTVNFYRSGGGCGNTGELAGIFDHEWGHGMDENDANPGVSNPGEGIADIYAALRLGTSCVGRGFRPGVLCGGYGDPCTVASGCTGIRDIDYAKRQSGLPHDVAWITANCPAGTAPCGGAVHCEGAVYSEAVWDLIHRDLPTRYGMDFNTAQEVGTRLTYLGGGNVGTWFSCNTGGEAGCAADSGYQQYVAADDDNGNLNDGTPHMQAIFDAFNRHGIACSTPTLTDSGCAGAPTTAPVVTATALDRGVQLSWGAVTGADSYQIFRTDGVFGCNLGKIKVGETTNTSFVDDVLQNGRSYSYVVIPMGPADNCLGPSSACTAVTPVAGHNLAIDESNAVLTIHTGDGDEYLDNCESATMTFDVINIGAGSHTNLLIDAVRSLSHPGISIDSINAVAPSTLGVCGSAAASFDFTAADLAFGDTVVFEVDVTSDELYPIVKTQTLTIDNAESDLQFLASKTYDFETDLESWEVIQGTFSRSSAGGGANGSSYYLRSSSSAPFRCDQIRSSGVKFTATTTMTVSTNFDIETAFSGDWFDRANIGVIEGGVRTLVEPDSGRLYNTDQNNGSCVTANQEGWADLMPTWASSGFSAAALGSVSLVGRFVRLDVAYATDELVEGDGFRFDHLTLTDVETQMPDSQSDFCAVACNVDPDCDDGLSCNGAETCVAGTCQAGTPVDCDDGVSCTEDSCNEGTDSCDNVTNNGNCGNGVFCDGAETCDAGLGCQAGTPVDCDDSFACTADSCNEGTDTCDHVTNDASCDDGAFCNGAETCDAGLGCQAGSDACPVSGQTCDEGADTCIGGSSQAQLESGSLSVSGTAVTVNLSNAYFSPVVVTTVQYSSNTTPVVTRIKNVTATSFDVWLQNPVGGTPVTENVSYLVVEEGTWTIDGVAVEAQTYLSTVTDEDASWVGEVQSYGQSYTNPVVLGQVMSENDAGFSAFWARGAIREDPPSATVLWTGKHVGEDTDVTRANETVGFIVFEAGHGTIGGVEYEAALGADTVEGVGNAPPYTYTFNTAFTSAPSVALLTMAGIDGFNGGWAQVHGATTATTTSLRLSIDEDQILDAERAHSSEQVGYIVFGSPAVAP